MRLTLLSGYLPHNGIATIAQFTQATQTVFGMGADLAAFLAVYGAVVDGNLLSWSIGGKPHTGIGGSHGNYETDSSPLKADLYQYGDMYKLVMSQWKEVRSRRLLRLAMSLTIFLHSCTACRPMPARQTTTSRS